MPLSLSTCGPKGHPQASPGQARHERRPGCRMPNHPKPQRGGTSPGGDAETGRQGDAGKECFALILRKWSSRNTRKLKCLADCPAHPAGEFRQNRKPFILRIPRIVRSCFWAFEPVGAAPARWSYLPPRSAARCCRHARARSIARWSGQGRIPPLSASHSHHGQIG